ncbi:MAG: hypothetical protein SFY32_05590 [Bacteroidota bacterium]|nr:hypothetical protein [Bacteroidota bacterium]
MKTRIILVLFCLNTLFSSNITLAVTIEDSIPPGKNFKKAAFRLWYPNEIKTITGIIVLVPGSNSDGRNMVEDSSWVEFAKQNNMALLACYYTDYENESKFVEAYCNVSKGSGQALIDAIDKFANKSQHNELSTNKLLLFGFSAGGQFNYEFACWKPERVDAFVVNKGGFYYTALAPKTTREVPGIFFTGEKDLMERKTIVKGIYAMNQRAGALWTFVEEQKIAHDEGQSKKLSIQYFQSVLEIKLIHKPLIELGKWGNFETGAFIIDKRAISPNDNCHSWLPNDKFAKMWQEVVRYDQFK